VASAPATQPLVFGEVLYDCFPDESVVLGGAPFNVAWHLQAFGQSPLFVSRVGNDELGHRIRAAMETWGMSTAGLQLDSEHPTGTVTIEIHDGEPAYDIISERAYDYIEADLLPPLHPSLIYHGTLALRNRVSAESLASLKRDHDAPVFVDVNLREPWWQREQVVKLMDGAHWVKLNAGELETLQDGTGSLHDRASRLLQEHGIGHLVVTRGDAGAVAFSGTGEAARIKPAPGATVVDTVGAGDAFTSVTILGVLEGWPQQQAMQRAQEFASAIVGIRGATVQDAGFYQPFIERWGLAVNEPKR
jgi:fructokinase